MPEDGHGELQARGHGERRGVSPTWNCFVNHLPNHFVAAIGDSTSGLRRDARLNFANQDSMGKRGGGSGNFAAGFGGGCVTTVHSGNVARN